MGSCVAPAPVVSEAESILPASGRLYFLSLAAIWGRVYGRQFRNKGALRGRIHSRECTPGRINGGSRPGHLSRPARWPVTPQRTRTHPEPRRQGWRHVMQGRAAIRAQVGSRARHPEPLAPRFTFRIDALNRPARQILHRHPPRRLPGTSFHWLAVGTSTPDSNCPDCAPGKAVNSRHSLRGVWWCQAKKLPLVVCLLQPRKRRIFAPGRAKKKGRGSALPFLLF